MLKQIIQGRTTAQLTISNFLPDPRRQSLSHAELEVVEGEIADNLFKNRQQISLNELFDTRDNVYKEIYAYEFSTFQKDKAGKISGEDFAKSIICYLSPPHVKKYMKDLDKVEWAGAIDLNEYIAFQNFLRLNYTDVAEKLESRGVLTRKHLKKLIKEYTQKVKAHISDDQLDIFIRIIDKKGNNLIHKDEFVGVVQSRTFYGSGESVNSLERPFVDLDKKFKTWTNKLERIWDIVSE